jgi:hypothetical protein
LINRGRRITRRIVKGAGLFEAGQRVRCVADAWFDDGGRPTVDPPALGGVYTVVDVRCMFVPRHGLVTSWELAELVELAEKPPFCGMALRWEAVGFRPLEDAEFERLREACLKPPLRVRELAGLLP